MTPTSDSRHRILTRLRETAPIAAPAPARLPAGVATGDPGSRRARFIAQAHAWQAEVIETTDAEWPIRMAALCRDRGIARLAAGRLTGIADRLGEWTGEPGVEWFDRPLEHCRNWLFRDVDAGVTTAVGAVAATGSVLLKPSATEPRSLSLVPPVHLVVLREQQLHESLGESLKASGSDTDMPSSLVLVSGPSKTADIQRMLVYGAHGPRSLVIFFVREPETSLP